MAAPNGCTQWLQAKAHEMLGNVFTVYELYAGDETLGTSTWMDIRGQGESETRELVVGVTDLLVVVFLLTCRYSRNGAVAAS